MSELAKTYDPKQIEAGVSALWQEGNYFHAEPDERGPEERFAIVIPPPNVTGALHLGHALNNTLQDILVRWHRMMGHNTLWMPGTDHAGIATQAVVEKRLLEEEGKNRHEIGRERLVERIWAWKDQYESRIIEQLKLMGCSCDFARKRFTLDEGCSRAVRETFFRLFKEGYIVRGKRLVNWDCELQTAVADDEVYHEAVKGKFYHFRYPIKDAAALGVDPPYLIIATTRPETMLADTAVAVNPTDARYKHLVGKTVLLPLMDREIPIIADEWADPEKGSGCVKITPAHDPNDYEVGQRHKLPMINILNPDGTINDNGGKYAGLDRFEARKAVLADLEQLELVENIEDHEHDVGHSDRSKTLIEPYLSDQWFLKMDTELTEKTLEAVRDGSVKFHPERYKNAYLDWLGEKRDWCISRQLWWGHRIPVWSSAIVISKSGDADDSKKKYTRDSHLSLNDPENPEDWPFTEGATQAFFDDQTGEYVTYQCLRSGQRDVERELEKENCPQDSDVLDTWFSSALWPHSTLGWPEKTKELDYYYPTSVLITSRDIITLWIVRMVLTGLYNMGEPPFRDVYIHPKILDGRGVTMSKSKGNGVDPLDIIEVFGADALRFAIAAMTTESQDIRMPVEYRCPHCEKLTPQTEKNMFEKNGNASKIVGCKHCKKRFATRWAGDAEQKEHGLALMVSDKFESARNFMNKLWNAARFAFINLDNAPPQPLTVGDLPREDRWILAELSEVIRNANTALASYQYSQATLTLRNFFWDSLCDWYLELTKFRINENHRAAEAKQVLAFCMDQILRLLHPIVPFATEHLWQKLNEIAPARGLPGIVELVERGGKCPAVLTVAPYPPKEGYPALDDAETLEIFHDLQSATRAVREVRTTSGIAPKDKVNVTIKSTPQRIEHLEHEAHILKRMARIENLVLDDAASRPPNSAVKIVGKLQIFVHDVVDDAQERERVEKDVAGLDKRIKSSEGRLSNEGYLRSAPPEVVEETRQILEGLKTERQTLEEVLQLLGE